VCRIRSGARSRVDRGNRRVLRAALGLALPTDELAETTDSRPDDNPARRQLPNDLPARSLSRPGLPRPPEHVSEQIQALVKATDWDVDLATERP
jgi:hypothetical protein